MNQNALMELVNLLRWRDPPPAPRPQQPAQPFMFGPGAIVTAAPAYPIGPGAVGPRQGPARGSVSDLQAPLVGGAPLPDQWTPPPEAPRRGFEPPSMPQEPVPQLAVRSSPEAAQGALADIEALGAGPWTERPEDFWGGLQWDLRERLIQRQMARMGAAQRRNAPER